MEGGTLLPTVWQRTVIRRSPFSLSAPSQLSCVPGGPGAGSHVFWLISFIVSGVAGEVRGTVNLHKTQCCGSDSNGGQLGEGKEQQRLLH